MQIVNNLVLTTRLPSHPVHTATAVYYSVSNVFRAATAFAAFPPLDGYGESCDMNKAVYFIIAA